MEGVADRAICLTKVLWIPETEDRFLNSSSIFFHSVNGYIHIQGSCPLVVTNVFWLFLDKDCLNLAGILILPFESSEYWYSPVKVLGLNVMMLLIVGIITHNSP